MKCEKCIYRKNCQFIASHKFAYVHGQISECTAFEDESQAYKDGYNAALKDFADALKNHDCSYDIYGYHSFSAVDIDNIDDIVEELKI